MVKFKFKPLEFLIGLRQVMSVPVQGDMLYLLPNLSWSGS